jgi:hypothetical protein
VDDGDSVQSVLAAICGTVGTWKRLAGFGVMRCLCCCCSGSTATNERVGALCDESLSTLRGSTCSLAAIIPCCSMITWTSKHDLQRHTVVSSCLHIMLLQCSDRSSTNQRPQCWARALVTMGQCQRRPLHPEGAICPLISPREIEGQMGK